MNGRSFCVLASGALLAAASAGALAQQHNFKLHHFLGPTAPAHTQMLVPWAQRAVLSKQKASSAVCQAPASSSIGDCQVKYQAKTGAAFCSCFMVAMRTTLLRMLRPFSPPPLHM